MLSTGFHCKENDRTTGAAQKQLHVEVSQDMLDSTNSDSDFMNTIITGNESWVYGYDPEHGIFLIMKIQREQIGRASCRERV